MADAAVQLREAQEEGLIRRWEEFSQCEELGAGGFGVVVRVTRKNHSYAVKKPHSGLQHDPSRLLELRGEFKMLKELYDDWLPQHSWDSEPFTPIVKARDTRRQRAQTGLRAAAARRMPVRWSGAGPRPAARRRSCLCQAARPRRQRRSHARVRASQVQVKRNPERAAPASAAPQVRGLFLSPALGILLELYGVALSDALQLPPGSAPDEVARRVVTRDVASACRFLHEKGVAHRDLKCSNVLVDPTRGFKAKARARLAHGMRARTHDTHAHATHAAHVTHQVTDFGTSHLVSQLSTSHIVQRGTMVYMAPELLQAQGAPAAALAALDYKKVDMYAFGILLCELWSGGRSPFCAMPREYGEEESDLLAQVCNAGWRPAVPEGMPGDYASLMQNCWQKAPEERLGFDGVCDVLESLWKAEADAAAAAASASPPSRTGSGVGSPLARGASVGAAALASAARAQTTCARVAIRYQPSVPRGAEVPMHVSFSLDPPGAAAAAAAPATHADGALGDDGFLRVELIFHVAPGDACQLNLQAVDGSESWLGSASGQLVPGAASQLTLRPRWEMAPELPECGVCAALRVDVLRTPPAASDAKRKPIASLRVLGSISMLLAPAPLLAARRSRGAWPQPAAILSLVRLPPMLATRPADIMVSYRDSETGLRSSNGFAFKVQEALEDAGYSVFCYATLVREGSAWVNVLTHGIQACRAFIPIASPQFGDIDISPWTYNEVVQAGRRQRERGSPLILPVWHHGAYPPADTAAVFTPAVRRVPAGEVPAESLPLEDVVEELLRALKEAGVEPSAPPS